MALTAQYNTNDGGPILPQGQHACRLTGVALTRDKGYKTEEIVERFEWSWAALAYKDPTTNEAGAIKVWTGPRYGNSKAGMTKLLDQIFGRQLTREEVERMDFERMVNVVQGFLLVLPHTKEDGTSTSKFGAFIPAPNVPKFEPSQFYAQGIGGGYAALSQGNGTGTATTPTPAPDMAAQTGNPFAAVL